MAILESTVCPSPSAAVISARVSRRADPYAKNSAEHSWATSSECSGLEAVEFAHLNLTSINRVLPLPRLETNKFFHGLTNANVHRMPVSNFTTGLKLSRTLATQRYVDDAQRQSMTLPKGCPPSASNRSQESVSRQRDELIKTW